MNSMSYKGYTARIEFDERDDIFVGRLLGVRDIISFHADSVAELRAELQVAVDDYLADCAERGVSPDKPASGKVMLRIRPESPCRSDHRRPSCRQEPEPVGRRGVRARCARLRSAPRIQSKTARCAVMHNGLFFLSRGVSRLWRAISPRPSGRLARSVYSVYHEQPAARGSDDAKSGSD